MSDIIKTTAKLSKRKIHVATVYAFYNDDDVGADPQYLTG